MKRKTLNRAETRLFILKEVKVKLIQEERMKREYINNIDMILYENKYLIEDSELSNQIINEQIFDTLFKAGGSILNQILPGLVSQFKQRIITSMAAALGFPKDSRLTKALINILEEIEYSKMTEYFENWKVGCPKLINTVIRGLSDTLQEGMFEYFGLNIQGQGIAGGTFREAVTTAVNEKLIPFLEPIVNKIVCSESIPATLSKLKDVATGKTSIKDIIPGGGAPSPAPTTNLSGAGANLASQLNPGV